MPRGITNPDFRLLKMFKTVVEAGGFAPAQLLLNVSQPALSVQMSQLESRLGVRLCQRGRAGFRLTEEGRRVYESTLRLLNAAGEFGEQLEAMQGRLVGELHLGIVDSVATNADFHLSAAIARFKRRDGAVRLALHVAPPPELERAVLDGRYHIAIGHFPTHVGSLQYRHLLREEHRLYVGRDHALFRAERDGSLARIRELEHVVRGYATTRPAPPEASVNATATANNMEAILVLILSGSFAGHLPAHFAEPWVKRRMLRPIASPQFLFHTDFDVISRKDATPTLATRVFLEDIAAAFAAAEAA